MVIEETSKFGGYGRTGVLHTRAGDVLTPTFMPDGTRGAVKGLTPEQVIDTGVGIVLANTYHLHLNPGETTINNHKSDRHQKRSFLILKILGE